jgi:hypothetical protein
MRGGFFRLMLSLTYAAMSQIAQTEMAMIENQLP